MTRGGLESRALHRLVAVALDEARAGVAEGGEPVGSVLADRSGRMLSRGRNMVIQGGDITAHAEMMAVRNTPLPVDWSRCTLITTAEPCWLCSGLILRLGISEVVVCTLVDGYTTGMLRDHGVTVTYLPNGENDSVVEDYYQYRNPLAQLRRDVRPATFDVDAPAVQGHGDGARFARWRHLYPYRRVDVPTRRVAVLLLNEPGLTVAGGLAVTDDEGEGVPARRYVAERNLERLQKLTNAEGFPLYRYRHRGCTARPDGNGDLPYSANALTSAGIRNDLRTGGIDTVIIAGGPASCCLEGTARGARDIGLSAYVPADTIWDSESSVVLHSLYSIDRRFGRVCHVDDISRSCARSEAVATPDVPHRAPQNGG